MGRDKALLPWGDETLLERAVRRLQDIGFTVAVAGAREPGVTTGVPAVPDNFPGCGPLGGIEAALRSLGEEPAQPVLFLPVDVPLIPEFFLLELWRRAACTRALATIPVAGGRAQPLCAVYSSSVAPAIAEALADGERKVLFVLERLIPQADTDRFRVEALAAARGWLDAETWFLNLNTQSDCETLHRFCSNRSAGEAPNLHSGASRAFLPKM